MVLGRVEHLDGNTNMKRSKNQIIIGMLLLTLAPGCAQLARWSGTPELPIEQELTTEQRDQLDIQFGLTRIVERKGQLEEAEKSYLEIIQLEPDYYQALHRLGVIAASQENLNQAIDFLESAVEIQSDSAELLGDLGYTCLLSCQVEKAEHYLSQAFDLTPDDSRITNNLALTLGYQGKLNEALRLFRRCNPESQALANIGYLHSQLGDFEQARRYYHAALDIDPTVEQAANGLVELEKIALVENTEVIDEAPPMQPGLEVSISPSRDPQ